MSLNFFELRKSFFYIFFQFDVNRVCDRGEFLADVGANPLHAVLRLRRQCRYLKLERVRLLLAAYGEMLPEGGVEIQKSFRQAIRGREAQIALRLLEASGEVGAGLGQFFVEVARDRI